MLSKLRSSSDPDRARRQAEARPAPSSAKPNANANEGAHVSASIKTVSRPARDISSASPIATDDRPGEPAGPHTTNTEAAS